MIIYLMRHGHAEPQITTDEQRCLTPKGVAETKALLVRRSNDISAVGAILASPLVRAQQTAQIAQQHCTNISIDTSDLLVPEADPYLLIEWLNSNYSALRSPLLLVSHQPFVGRLLGLICGKPEGFYPMGTSSLASIETDEVAVGLGSLRWIEHVDC